QLLVNNDYLEFLDYLLQQRKYDGYPPYEYQAQIIAESKRQGQVLELLIDVYSSISGSVNIHGSKPLPALHLKRNNVYRYSLLL
ncbi:primosomal protein N', partial [Francisella tularensis subsp. holarctica]|nr:primosomal protein N' [Francisella tularensis subsp. holarctica]